MTFGPRLIINGFTLIVSAVTVALATASAASEAGHETIGIYASTMTNAMPTLARGQEEMEKDCGSLSGPSGVKECIHGLESGAASVRIVRSRMSNLKIPDCFRDVDAKLRSALGRLQDGYSKAQKGLIAWMPVGEVMPVQDMDVMYSGMRDIEIGDQKLNEAIELLKKAMVTCQAQ